MVASGLLEIALTSVRRTGCGEEVQQPRREGDSGSQLDGHVEEKVIHPQNHSSVLLLLMGFP